MNKKKFKVFHIELDNLTLAEQSKLYMCLKSFAKTELPDDKELILRIG